MDYWINRDGITKGPFAIDQLRSMWEQGILTSDVNYYDVGRQVWMPLKSIMMRKSSPPPLPSNLPPISSGEWYPNTNIFSFSGRWPRTIFVLACGLYTALLLVIFVFLKITVVNFPPIFSICVLFWMYLMTCSAVKRMHDINWPAWGILVLPFGFTWIFLALISSHYGANRYGPEPEWY